MSEQTMFFKPKVDWWVPSVVIFTVVMCFAGPAFDGDWLVGAILAVLLCGIEIMIFGSVKYQIQSDRLGVRNLFYRWEWFPISKITEIKSVRSVLSASALSFNRLAIRFSDRTILKSSMPLEIAPKDAEGFIHSITDINSEIIVK